MANSQVKKFCTDCKWVKKEELESMWQCTAPKVKIKSDLVTGKGLPNFCSYVRMDDACGPEGKLWEPAEIRMD
jgi:hypothetical protein